MTLPTISSAITQIRRHGALLVFPIKSNPLVPSLWKCFHPRTTMRWEWSAESGNQVPHLWHLREELSRTRKVVYAKWFQGRATFFSLEVFTALLSCTVSRPDPLAGLDDTALRVYRTLLDDSPLPTRALRELAGFTGKEREAEFQRATRALWRRLLIVGYGEVEEGGFPSLAVGGSRLLFEEQWDNALKMTEEQREIIIARTFPNGNPFSKAYRKLNSSTER